MSQIPLSLTIFCVYVYENCNPRHEQIGTAHIMKYLRHGEIHQQQKWLMIVMILSQLMNQAGQPKEGLRFGIMLTH